VLLGKPILLDVCYIEEAAIDQQGCARWNERI